MENSSVIAKESIFNIGKRVRVVRALTGLSRKEFEEKFNISAATLRAWEDPQNNRKGLTKKGAIRLLAAFKEAGVYCNLDWLLYGLGTGPKSFTDLQREIIEPIQDAFRVPDPDYSAELAAVNDMYAFQANNPHAKVKIVDDENMLPCYAIGDYVGGLPVFNEQIETLIGENCIVETESNITLIRRVERGSVPNTYTLVSTNFNVKNGDFVISNVTLKMAAKVIWLRKV